MRVVTWTDIQREYRSERIGLLILAEAEEAVTRVARRYDPVAYGRVSDWADAIDDTVQQLVVDLLLGEGQLDYMMTTCRELEGFRALMAFQVRRLLARTRVRTVIDNLIERARTILRAEPFETYGGAGTGEEYGLARAEPRSASPDELWRAARSAALVPRLRVRSSERAPLVYSNANFKRLLVGIGGELGCRFGLSDVDAILRLVLTDFLPSPLESDRAADEAPSASRTTEEDVIVQRTAVEALSSLDCGQRGILFDKLAGLPDAEMAATRGMSRPTLGKRKAEVLDALRGHLEDLERTLQIAVFDELGLLLREEFATSDG